MRAAGAGGQRRREPPARSRSGRRGRATRDRANLAGGRVASARASSAPADPPAAQAPEPPTVPALRRTPCGGWRSRCTDRPAFRYDGHGPRARARRSAAVTPGVWARNPSAAPHRRRRRRRGSRPVTRRRRRWPRRAGTGRRPMRWGGWRRALAAARSWRSTIGGSCCCVTCEIRGRRPRCSPTTAAVSRTGLCGPTWTCRWSRPCSPEGSSTAPASRSGTFSPPTRTASGGTRSG